MTIDFAAWIVNVIANWPWLVWVYVGAVIVTTFIRSGWPVEADRPRWLVGLLAVLDLLQLNLSSPVRLVTQKKDPNPPLVNPVKDGPG